MNTSSDSETVGVAVAAPGQIAPQEALGTVVVPEPNAPRYLSLRAWVDAQSGHTRSDLARILGLKRSTFSQYLHGQRVPERTTALRLSAEFGISLEGLLNPPVIPVEVSA